MDISLKALFSLAGAAWQLAGLKAPGLLWRYVKLSLFLKKTAGKTIHRAAMKIDSRIKKDFENEANRGDIIIPVYNNFEDVKNLLQQIDQSRFDAKQVIIIDDASTDERISPLLLAFSQAAENRFLINNKNNLGFVGSINRGLDVSKNDVIILNTDIVLPDNALSRLFNHLWEDPNVATVTPFTNAGYLVGFPHLTQLNSLPWQASVDDIDRCFQQFHSLTTIDVPSGVGFCMAISRQSLNTVSRFDDAYSPGYGEETDFCLRARKAGFRNVIAPDLFVYHRNSGSFDKLKAQNLKRKNALRILQSHPEYQKILEDYFAAGEAELLSFLALILLCEHLSGAKFEFRKANGNMEFDTSKIPAIEIGHSPNSITATIDFRFEKVQKKFVDKQSLIRDIALLEPIRMVANPKKT